MSARGTANALTRTTGDPCDAVLHHVAGSGSARPLRGEADRHSRPHPGRHGGSERQRARPAFRVPLRRPRRRRPPMVQPHLPPMVQQHRHRPPPRPIRTPYPPATDRLTSHRSGGLSGPPVFFCAYSAPLNKKVGKGRFWAGGIEFETVSGEAHGAICIHHWRRGFLSWQRNCGRGTRSFAAGAGLPRSTAQAGPLSQRRSRHDEPDPAWGSVRHRTMAPRRTSTSVTTNASRGVRPPRPTTSPPVGSTRTSSTRNAAADYLGRHRPGHPARHQRDQGFRHRGQ